MKYVFLALFCGAIFLCCFLIDKLLQKLMQTRSLWQRFLYRMIYVIY